MKYFIYTLAIIILIGLNLGLFNNLQINNQIPNLLLLLTLYFSLEKDSYDFFFIAFVSGLFLDFYSAGFFGGFTLAFLSLALLLHLLASNFVLLELNWKSLSLLLAASLVILNSLLWLYGLWVYKLNWAFGYTGLKTFASAFLPGLIYNWLLLYPMYLCYGLIKNLIENLTIRRRGLVR